MATGGLLPPPTMTAMSSPSRDRLPGGASCARAASTSAASGPRRRPRSIAFQPKQAADRLYQVGDKVGVRRQREVYGHSWFHAKVAKVIDKMSYLVEYSDLDRRRGKGRPWPRRPSGIVISVEAYCDVAWSAGVVRRIVREGEYEVSVNGKTNEIVMTKARELLQPQYKWNGKNWRIVSAKRHSRHQSPADVNSSDDEQSQDNESSAWTRSRKRSKKEFKATQLPEVNLPEDFDVVSREADSGSNTQYEQDDASNLTTVLQSAVARKKGFKKSDSQHNLLDATTIVQPIRRNKAAGQLESETHIQQQLDKTLEDNLNANQVTDQELLPLIPPGFESIANGKCSCDWNTDGLSKINLHSSLFDEELAATISSICEDNHNGDAQTDNVASQVAEISHLMEKPMLPLDRSVGHEVGGKLPGQQAPFTKTKDTWSVFEMMEVFRMDPQEPHFLPLRQQFPEAMLENMCIGKLRITDNMKLFKKQNTSLNSLVENGCSVQYLQWKLNKALEFKLDRTHSLAYREKLKQLMLENQSSLSRIGASCDENDNATANLEMKLGRRRWDG
uniref:Agenet-like domain-containing protein n=1 Tax=Oryza punctata TaxID=4537 RepID=A0A0E0MGA8_ORYPU